MCHVFYPTSVFHACHYDRPLIHSYIIYYYIYSTTITSRDDEGNSVGSAIDRHHRRHLRPPPRGISLARFSRKPPLIPPLPSQPSLTISTGELYSVGAPPSGWFFNAQMHRRIHAWNQRNRAPCSSTMPLNNKFRDKGFIRFRACDFELMSNRNHKT